MSIAKDVAESLSNQDDQPVAVSAVVLGDRIGYPRRVIDQDGKTHDGELKDFDEAYDFASKIFDTTNIEIEKDEQYVWFTDNS